MDYIEINRKLWNGRVEDHLNSSFYQSEAIVNGKSSLNSIELDLLGSLTGKSLIHLQCHFGLDTISLARLGADATGVDFSEKAIDTAKELSEKAKVDAQYLCADVYALPELILKRYDVVFTSYGVLGWLPDMQRWAKTVASLLKPGGMLVLVEFHPFVWMFDSDFKKVVYPYSSPEPIVEESTGSYAQCENGETQKEVGWNHGLSDVVQSLIDQQLEIEVFREYDYSPYNCFSDMEEFESGKFRVRTLSATIPVVYALKARRRL